MNTRKKVSLILKLACVMTSLSGTVIALCFAVRDGYLHPLYRLLYFTNLSNLSIGLCFIAILCIPFINTEKREIWERRLYLLKYIFTVSIAITGIVFCGLLAPFAKDYNPWTFSSFLTHVFTPAFAIIDFFVDTHPLTLRKLQVFSSAIPPFIYLAFASVLAAFKVDFGRGDPFPYFFLNYYSPAGIFGFSDQPPYVFGSLYWILLFLAMVLSIAALLAAIKNHTAIINTTK